ncbi:phosphotransferase enzyme family protein [Streptomyces sp. NBC_00233]|uniref:phosphotransferase enzyme family protein n=1 Tax=Streptomyces sp. NBC_00233 TaxID=2975686 RepID=UPI002254A192|nr:aminoglycoside phosphotransferase family protein [Streptomyces sp. NBC_00233]MCX5232374.1 aminoglycoside phosphotransferase family protein [Streptomyces sp. NBC_00233]
MKQTKLLPADLQHWAEQRIGPVVAVRDASHDWPRSRVWELRSERGIDWYVKVSPGKKFFTRETRAYRHVVPALGHRRAPHLVDSRAGELAMLLSVVPGAPASELGPTDGEWRAVHRQAGALCARLHEAGPLDRADLAEAQASLEAAADGAEKYLARAGARLTADEQQVIRDHAARLRRVGPVPVGYVHGDNQPRNWLWSTTGLALVDFERTRPAARVQDLVILAVGEWLDHPDREQAFLQAYGRALSTAERHALRCLTALDAANCLAWGPDNDDAEVTARGRRTLDRLMRENRP